MTPFDLRRKLVLAIGGTALVGLWSVHWSVQWAGALGVMRRFAMSGNGGQSAAKMPVVFLGHGSPMNALADNYYTRALEQLARDLPRPQAILCVSAHWLTKGTAVTHMLQPPTIHDFRGFPQALFDVNYPAPGYPKLADQLALKITQPTVLKDDTEWGLDHGTWSVLRHLYPKADIPVLQLSIDIQKTPEFHFELGKKLSFLRDHGILILGSGNIVHNLRKLDWNENAPAYSWATEFDEWVKSKLDRKDFAALYKDHLSSEAGRLSVPTPDHYYPLLYVLGAASESDKLRYIFEGIQNASISMRCLQLG